MVTLAVTDTVTLDPGETVLVQPFVPNNVPIVAQIAPGQLQGNVPAVYADVAVALNVTPSGGVVFRTKSLLLNPAVGVGFLENVSQWGAPGWFLILYAVNRPNGTSIDVLIYRPGNP